MPIATIAISTAKPAAAEQVESALTELAEATHAQPGCIRYTATGGGGHSAKNTY